jgi:hypothetical protein
MTSSTKPIYRIIDVSETFIRKSPQRVKEQFPVSRKTDAIPELSIHKLFNSENSRGRQIDFSDEQPSNTRSPRFESLEPFPNATMQRFRQYPKQVLDIVSIDEGRQIDCSDEQVAKTDSPRVATVEPFSKTTLESLLQLEKQREQIILTDEGIQIDSSEEQISNACSPRVETCAILSNATIDR